MILLLFSGILRNSEAAYANETSLPAEQDKETILIELFVFAPCESCHEEEKFSEKVRSLLSEAEITDYECRVYNAYKESGADRLEEASCDFGVNTAIKDFPVAIVEGEVFTGSYQSIGEKIAEHLLSRGKADGTRLTSDLNTVSDKDAERIKVSNSDVYRDISDVGNADTSILLFVTGSCDSCKQAEDYLQSILTNEDIGLHIYNITDDENAVVIRKLMKIYEVPDNQQQVPLLFLKNGYFSGADAIRKHALSGLEGQNVEGPWEDVAGALLNETEDLSISKVRLAVTGFVNGLNPCGISMLIMVLSVLLMSGKSFYKGSFTYLAGKFFAYLILGFSFGLLFSVIEGNIFRTVHETINIIFAILALGFGLFYFMDFIHVLKKDYGKERLRLPERFRRWNHSRIKKLAEVRGKFWYPMLFLLGMVISAGEFLCTGQVYLATLLYMAGQKGTFDVEIVVDLIIYLMAMCVPMILLTVLVSKGKNVMSASHLSLKLLPVVKLLYSIFFFVLFFSLLF